MTGVMGERQGTRRRRRREPAAPEPAAPEPTSPAPAPLESRTTAAVPPVFFYPSPIWKLLLLSSLGGIWYGVYWSYRGWRAYREAWGYSLEPFWRALARARGVHPMPVGRALCAPYFVFSLLPAIARECARAGLRATPAPILFACLWCVAAVGQWISPSLVAGLVLGLVTIPAQINVNRLERRAGRDVRASTSVGEVALVLLGSLRFLASLGAP